MSTQTEPVVTMVAVSYEAIGPMTGGSEEEAIDWEATNERFAAQVEECIKEWYPYAEITLEAVYGVSGQDTRAVVDTNEPLTARTIDVDVEAEAVRDIVGTIYANQEFWVEAT